MKFNCLKENYASGKNLVFNEMARMVNRTLLLKTQLTNKSERMRG